VAARDYTFDGDKFTPSTRTLSNFRIAPASRKAATCATRAATGPWTRNGTAPPFGAAQSPKPSAISGTAGSGFWWLS